MMILIVSMRKGDNSNPLTHPVLQRQPFVSAFVERHNPCFATHVGLAKPIQNAVELTMHCCVRRRGFSKKKGGCDGSSEVEFASS
jgi:hypothetical protein